MTQPVVQVSSPNEAQHRLVMATTINELLKGRANNAGTLTLADGTTTTTVLDNQFQSDMVPLLIPTTANAAAALATTYLTARDNGSFELTHDNDASTDRTFLYVRWG